jgi:hypothetical protein
MAVSSVKSSSSFCTTASGSLATSDGTAAGRGTATAAPLDGARSLGRTDGGIIGCSRSAIASAS